MAFFAPAALATPAVLVLSQPALNGLDAVLAKFMPAKAVPTTRAICKGASYGIGIASIAALFSGSITMLPAIGIGAGIGAVAGAAAKLLHHFYTRTAAGRRLAALLGKIPAVIRKPIVWVAKGVKWLVGDGRTMTSDAATLTLRRSLHAMAGVTGPIGRIATTGALLISTRIVNLADRKTHPLFVAGAGAIAGAAMVAPAVMETLPLGPTAPVEIAARVAVIAGAALIGAGIAVFAGKAVSIVKEGFAAAKPEPTPPTPPTKEPVPAAEAEPTAVTINLVDGTVTMAHAPSNEVPATLSNEAMQRINAQVSQAVASEEHMEFAGPVRLTNDLYSVAMQRRMDEGMTGVEAAASLKTNKSRKQRRRSA